MGLVPFAFSIHQLVSSVGADVGFAAIVGLAILVLLYFAQARETANLREQAFQAAQRVEHLEARIAQVARRQTAPAPAPAGAAPAGAAMAVSRRVPSAAAVGARAQMAPGPPAGVAAPALAAATRMVPTAVPAPSQLAPAVMGAQNAGASAAPPDLAPDGLPASEPGPAEAPAIAAAAGISGVEAERAGAGAGAGGPRVPGEPVAGAGVLPAEPAAEDTAVPGPEYEGSGAVPPATFAGAGNGATRDYAHEPSVSRRDGPPSPADRSSSQPADRSPLLPPERPRARQIPPRRPPLAPEAPRRRSRVGRLIALLAGAAAAGAAVVVLLMLTQNKSTSSPSPKHQAAGARSGRKAGAFNPSTVTVAVLNGTAVQGLAARTAARLHALGYKEGTVATASNQTFTSTVVAYMPSRRPDALQVARALKLKPPAVQPIDSSTQGVACPQSPCNAQVVVTTGADIASR